MCCCNLATSMLSLVPFFNSELLFLCRDFFTIPRKICGLFLLYFISVGHIILHFFIHLLQPQSIPPLSTGAFQENTAISSWNQSKHLIYCVHALKYISSYNLI